MARIKLIHEPLTYSIIGAFFEVYEALGFGFLEQVYVESLSRALTTRGHRVGREVSVPVFFRGEQVARHRLDMIVDNKVVVEAKSTEILHQGAVHQVTSYLRSTNLEVGLLLHFGPRPRFFRVVCSNSSSPDQKISVQRDPLLPPPPRNSFVSGGLGNVPPKPPDEI
jgi:GxxExxY protein